MSNLKDSLVYDGWNIAMSVGSMPPENYSRYGVKFDEKIFPRGSSPDPDEIVPDSIVDWLREKKED